jgi:hypothetical protein
MRDIQELAQQFAQKTLPKAEWTHAAHIAVAFVYMHQYKDFEKAFIAISSDIKSYNVSTGTANTSISGYHETITKFWLMIINEYISCTNDQDIFQQYSSFIKSSIASAGFPLLFYSDNILFSHTARQLWVEPDLLALSEIRPMLLQHI